MAPEVLARAGHGFPVDVYNLGCMLYEMLTGDIPYYSRDQEVLKRNIAQGVLEVPEHVSDVACDFIQDALDRNPLGRPGAMNIAELQTHAFFRGLDFDQVFHRKVEVPQLPNQQPNPILRRMGAKATPVDECFFPDKRPDQPDMAVLDWDFSGDSALGDLELVSRRARASERFQRAACLACFWRRPNTM
jgi:serine/threonine protein kinase